MDNNMPETTINPNALNSNRTAVNPNAISADGTTINPNAINTNGTAINPNALNSAGTAVNPNGTRNGTAEQYSRDGRIPAGTIIGDKYQVDSLMSAEGAEPILYTGTNIDTGEKLCIKMYHDRTHVRADVRDALLGISHRNIAKLHAWGYWNEMIYEVWTLYNGQNLQKIIARGSLPEQQISGYVRQMNEALHVVHTAGLVHQDIKPANFIVMADGSIVLIDFGISAKKDEDGRTHVTVVGHTTDYAPLEVLIDKYCWPASDYYSMGITVYEMLRGKTPYADYDESMRTKKLVSMQTTDVPDIDKFSQKVKDLIIGLLQYEREDRWGYEAIHAWLAGDYSKFIIPTPIPDPKKTHKPTPIKPQTHFQFAGKDFSIPSEMPELVTYMAYNWDKGITYMDGEGRFVLLRNCVEKIDNDIWSICNTTRTDRDANLNYFTKLYSLYPELKIFAWRGYVAEDSQKLGEAILNAMWQNQIKSATHKSSRTYSPFGRQMAQTRSELTYSSLEDIFTKHVIPQYLEYQGNDSLAVKIAQYEEEIARCWRQNQNVDLWYYRIGYALSGSTKLWLGRYYADKSAFVKRVNDLIETCKNSRNNDEFVEFCRLIYNAKMDPGFVAWAEALGMGDEIAKLERALEGDKNEWSKAKCI